MTRSTAGTRLACACGAPSAGRWVWSVVDRYRGPLRNLALEVARATRVVNGQFQCAVGVAELARRSGIDRNDVGGHLAVLVADGYLDAGPRGRGWGVRTTYTLAQPALLRRSEIAGSCPPSPAEYAGSSPPSPPESAGVCPPSPAEYAGSSPPSPRALPLAGVVRTTTTSVGTDLDGQSRRRRESPAGQPTDPRVAEVIADLPAPLLPRSEDHAAEIAEMVAGWLAAGWTPAGIVREAAASLRPGPVSSPPAMLRNLIPPRPVTILRAPAERGPMCPVHAFQDAASCRGCAADAKAAGGAS